MDQKEVIEIVKLYKELVSKFFDVDKVYLFGSYARNSHRMDSDIDVAIVVDSIEGDFFQVNPLLWKLRREIDDRIEPVLIEKNHDESGFLSEIQKYGIAV